MIALGEAHDAARYGGKAAGLALALAHGLPVPPGIAIDHLELSEALQSSASCSELAARIALTLPGALAIRSSAVGEDGARASFAGQHVTRLNARGAAAIADALREVAGSARSAGALAYRARLGLSDEPRMAIVAQELVAAETAGVLFTRNPSSGADERVIEAVRGLGEAVVQGLVTPDHIRLSREGRLIEQRVGAQDLMIVALPDGGTEERAIEPAGAPCLDARALAALNALAERAEALAQGPLDLEWAFSRGRLYLLQARRITR